MATLSNKRKLAAISRETPEGSRSSRAQNVLDPELTQDYISQVPEEIEKRVTKKLSKEFSKTESRILGALSKLDEFFLNLQVRTCSVAGTSGNNNSENRETTRDRFSDDPCPEGDTFLITLAVRTAQRQKPTLTLLIVFLSQFPRQKLKFFHQNFARKNHQKIFSALFIEIHVNLF